MAINTFICRISKYKSLLTAATSCIFAIACSGGSSENGEANNALVLDSLIVSGEEIILQPEFDPKVSRYSILPTANTSAITVDATANGANLNLSINEESSLVGFPAVLDTLSGTDVIQIELIDQDSDASAVYELIYLPVGYPQMKVTTLDEERVGEGDLFLNPAGEPFFATVIANNGVPEFVRPTLRSTTFTAHENGQYSYNERIADGEITNTNERVLLDSDFQEVERVTVAPPLTNTDSHDFLILPSGNYVFISYEPIVHDGVLYEDSIIQEVDSDTGEALFQWTSWGVIPLSDQLSNNETDYAHMNSVIVDNDGNYMVSLRGTSQIVKINRETSEVMWKLGGMSNEFAIDDPLGGPCGQHNVTRLSSGNILLFDNGIFCPPEYPERGERSRAIEYELDEQNKTAKLVWSYGRDDTYGRSGGSAQRLPNGNTLIGWGGNPTGPSATEVDAGGDVVFELYVDRGVRVRGSNRVLRF